MWTSCALQREEGVNALHDADSSTPPRSGLKHGTHELALTGLVDP